jgi:uncharacterized protein (DUF305 family)
VGCLDFRDLPRTQARKDSVRHHLDPRASMRRLSAAVLGATATAGLLTGCGADDPNRFNEADTAYATGLISHHAQTLQLLDLTLGRDSLDPQIGTLADQTRQARFDEAAAAQKWLRTWGKKAPKTALEHTHDQDGLTYDTSIPGILSRDEMHTLERAKGAAFAQAWLRELVAHEQGAVKLAADAAEDGQNADVVAFAKKDEKAHQRMVAELERLQAP